MNKPLIKARRDRTIALTKLLVASKALRSKSTTFAAIRLIDELIAKHAPDVNPSFKPRSHSWKALVQAAHDYVEAKEAHNKAKTLAQRLEKNSKC